MPSEKNQSFTTALISFSNIARIMIIMITMVMIMIMLMMMMTMIINKTKAK